MTRDYHIIENQMIPLADGRQLAARIWLPEQSNDTPVAAILEYLPYRKRDGTVPRDLATYPNFAKAGYAGVRVDIAGFGESDGHFDDEYSPRELADAVEVIQWIAQQRWCSGAVGMMGISWGGFNSLQVAALRPPALKAVIAIGTTVDRYNDDIHYKQGCQLYSNFQWSSTMLCFAARPPDPLLVGDRWQQMWLERLQSQPFPLPLWLAHQRRDAYWQHGSVGEDYAAIDIPCLVISGWADGYSNAPPAMAANKPSSCFAINGPWIHKYPHFAYPHPRLDFINEALTWWDSWLTDGAKPTQIPPAYRAYLSENVDPNGCREQEAGRWVAEKQWPSPNVTPRAWYLNAHGKLNHVAQAQDVISFSTPQDVGSHCGEFFPLKPGSEMATDQQHDRNGCAIFTSEPLTKALDILGQPTLNCSISVDQPVANLIIRLLDVRPDGSSHRVSWGALNLCHRQSQSEPSKLQIDERYDINIALDQCGYRFLPGHKLEVVVSTAYWPMIVPSPNKVTATLQSGKSSYLQLPEYESANDIAIATPEEANPLADFALEEADDYCREFVQDIHNHCSKFRVYDDTGRQQIEDHGLITRHTHEEIYTIDPNDPLSHVADGVYTCELSRDDWHIFINCTSQLRVDADFFHVSACVKAYENEQLFNERHWQESIPRDMM